MNLKYNVIKKIIKVYNWNNDKFLERKRYIMLLRISLICFIVLIYIITFAFCKAASVDRDRDYDDFCTEKII